MAEVDVAHEPDRLERSRFGRRGQVERRLPPASPPAISAAETGPRAANSASITSPRAADTRRPPARTAARAEATSGAATAGRMGEMVT